MNEEIIFEVMDKDTFTKDDVVGMISVRISSLCDGIAKWLPLEHNCRNVG